MINYLASICCPICKTNLFGEESVFLCSECKKEYEIKNGIPVLVDLKKLPEHLVKQIEYFKNETIIANDQFGLDEWQKSYLERFNNNFPDVQGKTILDCGAGSGYMSIELAKKGARVVACDLTLKGLVRLQKISNDLGLDIGLICCSAEDLPFKDNSFDYFISNAVLEHLPREKDAIREINRVCKKGAGLMVAVPLSYWFLNPFLLPVNYVHDKRIGHLRRYDKKILEDKFGGWDWLNIYYTGHTKKVTKTLINMVVNVFDNLKIEKDDMKKEGVRKWASNIICFMRKIGGLGA